jgi:hypothetical protein
MTFVNRLAFRLVHAIRTRPWIRMSMLQGTDNDEGATARMPAKHPSRTTSARTSSAMTHAARLLVCWLQAGTDVFHSPVEPEGTIKGVSEPVPAIEPGGLLAERVNDHQPGRDGFSGQDGHAESISEQARAQSGALLTLIDRQPGDQDHADRVARHAADQLLRCVGPLDRAHRQADVSNNRVVPHDDEGARRVHLLGRDRVASEPSIEFVGSAGEAGDVMVGAQALETQLGVAQLRGSGSARNSSASSGTTVAGSSRAA